MEARKLMEEAGYGPSKKVRLAFPVRSVPAFVRVMTLVADQLRTIYIEGDIEPKEVSVMQGLLMKGAFALTFLAMASHFDDPDIVLYEHYSCKSAHNRSGFCNSEIEAKINEQSATVDPVKRRRLVEEIDLLLLQNLARIPLYYEMITRCWHPHVKGFVWPTNGMYTHNRMENVWLDK